MCSSMCCTMISYSKQSSPDVTLLVRGQLTHQLTCVLCQGIYLELYLEMTCKIESYWQPYSHCLLACILASSEIYCNNCSMESVQVLTKAGLLGAHDTASLTEYVPSFQIGQSVDEPTESQRHERFSFAVARTLDTTEEQLQELLAVTSTAKRLTAMYDAVGDGRGYLAGRHVLTCCMILVFFVTAQFGLETTARLTAASNLPALSLTLSISDPAHRFGTVRTDFR